jgi:hypothetical protein
MRIVDLHKMLVEGGERNWNAVSAHLKQYPEDRYVRNKWSNFCTLLHSAVLGCNLAAINNIKMTHRDLFAVDVQGRNALHYIVLSSKDVSQQTACLALLASILNAYQPLKTSSDVALGYLDDDGDEGHERTTSAVESTTKAGGAGTNSFKDMFAPGSKVNILKSGWLKKKRGNYYPCTSLYLKTLIKSSVSGGFMWQRRWAILTEDHMVYFKDPANLSMPKFAIPLEGCSITRVAGSKEPVLEITSQLMGEKKGLFGTSNKVLK